MSQPLAGRMLACLLLMTQANQPVGPYSIVRFKCIEKQERLIDSFKQLSSEKISFTKW